MKKNNKNNWFFAGMGFTVGFFLASAFFLGGGLIGQYSTENADTAEETESQVDTEPLEEDTAFDEEITSEKEAMSKEESDLSQGINKAYELRDAGKNKEAMEVLKDFLADNPDNVKALVLSGEIYGMMENYGKAEEVIKKSLDKVNIHNKSWAYRALGTIYRDSNQYEKAEKYLKMAIDKSYSVMDKAYGNYETGKLYIMMNREEKAKEHLKTAVDLSPEPHFIQIYKSVTDK